MSRYTFEVTDFEHRCTRLCCGTLQLGAMYFDESLGAEIFTEEVADARL